MAPRLWPEPRPSSIWMHIRNWHYRRTSNLPAPWPHRLWAAPLRVLRPSSNWIKPIRTSCPIFPPPWFWKRPPEAANDYGPSPYRRDAETGLGVGVTDQDSKVTDSPGRRFTLDFSWRSPHPQRPPPGRPSLLFP